MLIAVYILCICLALSIKMCIILNRLLSEQIYKLIKCEMHKLSGTDSSSKDGLRISLERLLSFSSNTFYCKYNNLIKRIINKHIINAYQTEFKRHYNNIFFRDQKYLSRPMCQFLLNIHNTGRIQFKIENSETITIPVNLYNDKLSSILCNMAQFNSVLSGWLSNYSILGISYVQADLRDNGVYINNSQVRKFLNELSYISSGIGKPCSASYCINSFLRKSNV